MKPACKPTEAAPRSAVPALSVNFYMGPLVDIALHPQVGNRRRGFEFVVPAWHRQEQTRRKALAQLGADLDSEIFAL